MCGFARAHSTPFPCSRSTVLTRLELFVIWEASPPDECNYTPSIRTTLGSKQLGSFGRLQSDKRRLFLTPWYPYAIICI
jgi:hypothetical protein